MTPIRNILGVRFGVDIVLIFDVHVAAGSAGGASKRPEKGIFLGPPLYVRFCEQGRFRSLKVCNYSHKTLPGGKRGGGPRVPKWSILEDLWPGGLSACGGLWRPVAACGEGRGP